MQKHLHMNAQASHESSSRFLLSLPCKPHLTNPNCLEYLTTLSFPDLSVATLEEDSISTALDFLSNFAKSGCTVICPPWTKGNERARVLSGQNPHDFVVVVVVGKKPNGLCVCCLVFSNVCVVSSRSSSISGAVPAAPT